MRQLCAPAAQGRSMFMGHSGNGAERDTLNQSIAAFLVARPPVALLGSRWQDASWSPMFELDAGEPAGLCAEGPAGVFSRAWSRGVAAIDCNSFSASLPFELFKG